jgi:hypothetical protein
MIVTLQERRSDLTIRVEQPEASRCEDVRFCKRPDMHIGDWTFGKKVRPILSTDKSRPLEEHHSMYSIQLH